MQVFKMQVYAYIYQMNIAALLGVALLVVVALNVGRWLWQYVWLTRSWRRPRLAERYGRGSWALITGASDGLGKAFAQEFAAHGFNLLLVSRTQAKLDRLKAELEGVGVEVDTLCADLSDASEATYARVADAARAVDLSVVVNCVGATVHRLFADVPSATLRSLLSINVSTTSIITHRTLPGLLRHATATGRRSALINVGSIVGRFHWPGTQLYGACKAFIDHLTVPLAFEYGRHLDVLSFQPTVMATAMAAGTEPAAITISPQAAARAALAHLGCCVRSHGHWRHALLGAFFAALPTRLRNRIFMSTALEMAEVELAKEH
jgi:17beta-estradiol 17-dehydrogenase / very-long-chain 3-oxoacyl-CoA reductase